MNRVDRHPARHRAIRPSGILRPRSSPDASDPPPKPGVSARRRPGTPRRPPVARGPPPRRRRRRHWREAEMPKRANQRHTSFRRHSFFSQSRSSARRAREKGKAVAAIPPELAAGLGDPVADGS
jgi:hypothetical protein